MLLLLAAGFYAGVQNALAGGGSFVTFPALMLAGLDARAANVSSCIALFPSQVVMAWTGRRLCEGAGGLGFATLMYLSLAGGAAGAVLLLVTPPQFFARLVPWLVLFATVVYAWGSFRRRPDTQAARVPARALAVVQTAIAVYGGYFGGGIGFLMLAALAAVGQSPRQAGATKNALAMAMNASAVLIFAFSADVGWREAAVLAAGAAAGGWCGAHLLHRLPEKWLRAFVVSVGSALTLWLFLR
ncbi:MAG: sulfite exporter TauE/SafE family protein [Rhodocyclaceae bacterium]|nr:sulfite exporter TauE/SafE family protein [Rhodocyclaceae bacterium]